MKRSRAAVIVSALLLNTLCHCAVGAENCPRTIGTKKVFSEPWPQAATWFGTEGLAVMLPTDGVWPTTSPGHVISVKLFWYRAGFQPGQEKGFSGRIKRLDDGPNDAVLSRPTNAGGESLGAWTILTGIDFPSPGCWEITGEYAGQSLTFVVETVRHDQYRNDVS